MLIRLLQSVAASDYQPQLAIGVADGSCLTTNTLRATRRGGSVVSHNMLLRATIRLLLTVLLEIAILSAQDLSARLQP